MLCQICGKNPATVHFTEIHDNQLSEIHVCQRCAAEKGIQAAAEQHKFDIANLLAGMVDNMTQSESERVGHVQCPRCGLMHSQFKETGRLGCADCYAAFEPQLRVLLRRIHGDTHHRGKHPVRSTDAPDSRPRQIQRLHDELRRAVEREDFETAASLRDEIRRLEADLQAERAAAEGRS